MAKGTSSIQFTAPACKAFVLGFVGVVVGRFSSGLGATLWQAATLLTVVLVLVAGTVFMRVRLPHLVVMIPIAWLLLGATKILLDLEQEPHLPQDPGSRLIIVGMIADDPEVSARKTRFLLDAEFLSADSMVAPFRTRMIVTMLPRTGAAPAPRIGFGMTVALRGIPELPSAERNPGEFSVRSYYEANGITHLLTVRGWENVRVVHETGGSWWMRNVVLRARRWMLRTFQVTTGGEEGEFLKGLILGERGGMSTLTKEAFINAGVAHVLAVSGSNVAVVAALLFFSFGLIRIPRTPRVVLVLGGLVFYMQVTGSQPPVVRATIMAAIVLTGQLVPRRVNSWNALGASGLAILAVDARQAFDIGFQLSYGAVASLMALYPVMQKRIARMCPATGIGRIVGWVLRVCAVSLAATLGTLPLTAVTFGQVSVIGVIANILVIPATEFSVLLGAATLAGQLCAEWIGQAYGALNWYLLHWTLLVTHLAGFSSLAYIETTRFGVLDAIPYYAVLVAFFTTMPRKPQRVFLVVVAATTLELWSSPFRNGANGALLRVSVIDVGQGDAILVEYPDGPTLLIDAGPKSPTFDAGRKTVLPFLRRRGVGGLEVVVASHLHADHIGGLPSVASGMPVRRIVSLTPSALMRELNAVPSRAASIVDSVRSGELLRVSSLARTYVLYPLRGAPVGYGGGNESIVLKIQFGHIAFLLPGDAESGEERLLVEGFGEFLHAQWLKAGHHGSRTSSSAQWLDAVRPTSVVVSVGRHNTFRHPSPSVLERFADRGYRVSRTDEEGALLFETDGSALWKVRWNPGMDSSAIDP
jgi:competence protein ComEC